ncbi:tissue factor-like [Notolabrus celidotus]|uniref:tissue factor-like n=1 Tax=Notolabrus celidotus TaxID=1203425 RepID=UPI001490565B|nr:tissue factor-like [Notolabrus celidotus]
MGSLRAFIYLGVCVCAGILTAADENTKAGNVHWTSLDFKTMLIWTTKSPQQTYSVKFRQGENGNSEPHNECFKVPGTECDMTHELAASDRSYIADVETDHDEEGDYDYSHEEFEHTESKPFNPYKESNISAVEFTVEALNASTIIVNVTDTLTSVHRGTKQLNIRDVFRKDLQYKISYHKSGNSRKRDHISDGSVALVPQLDAGQSYCFMVAAFIPSRPQSSQLGAWSQQLCEQTHPEGTNEMSVGHLVGIIFIVLLAIIIIITVTCVCCKKNQQRNKPLQTAQSSALV